MRGFLLDTNVFNHLLEGRISQEDLPLEFPVFVTHLQRTEIMNCPDVEKRRRLISLVNTLPDDLVPLQTCLAGTMRAGDAVGSGDVYQEILEYLNIKKKRKNMANIYDALIGEVAIIGEYVLVSNDQLLIEKVKELGGYVRDHIEVHNEGEGQWL